MIAAAALILLADVAAPCATADDARLGGGAMLVRPVGTDGAAPLVPLGPTVSVVTSPSEVQQVGAVKPNLTPPADQAPGQCPAISIHIV